MSNEYDFDKLKNTIVSLEYKEQLKRWIIVRTKYLQNVNSIGHDPFEISFDQKCYLEISKIKELIALDKI